MSYRRRPKKRNELEIWAGILHVLTIEDSTITRIVRVANLNAKRASGYIIELIEAGHIQRRNSNPTTYAITEKGIRWLKDFSKVTRKKSELPKVSDSRFSGC